MTHLVKLRQKIKKSAVLAFAIQIVYCLGNNYCPPVKGYEYHQLKEMIKQGDLERSFKALSSPLPGISQEDYFFLRGRIFQEMKKNVDAVISYTKALDLNPKMVKALSNRALARAALQDLDGALDDISTAASIDSTNPALFLNRSAILAGMNRQSEALVDLSKSLKVSPSYADAYRNRGIIMYMNGRTKEACADWRLAMKNSSEMSIKEWLSHLCK